MLALIDCALVQLLLALSLLSFNFFVLVQLDYFGKRNAFRELQVSLFLDEASFEESQLLQELQRGVVSFLLFLTVLEALAEAVAIGSELV